MTGFQNRSFDECHVSVEKSARKLSFFLSPATANDPIRKTKNAHINENRETSIPTAKETIRTTHAGSVNSGFVSPQTLAFLWWKVNGCFVAIFVALSIKA